LGGSSYERASGLGDPPDGVPVQRHIAAQPADDSPYRFYQSGIDGKIHEDASIFLGFDLTPPEDPIVVEVPFPFYSSVAKFLPNLADI